MENRLSIALLALFLFIESTISQCYTSNFDDRIKYNSLIRYLPNPILTHHTFHVRCNNSLSADDEFSVRCNAQDTLEINGVVITELPEGIMDSFCDRFDNGCKSEYDSNLYYVKNFTGIFTYEENNTRVDVFCDNDFGTIPQELICNNSKWELWDKGIKVEKTVHEFCKEKSESCFESQLPYFIEKFPDLDEGYSDTTTITINCLDTTKSASLSARCSKGNWVYSMDNVEKSEEFLELYCESSKDKCSFSWDHSLFLYKSPQYLLGFSPKATTHFYCFDDHLEHNKIEAKCVVSSESSLDWEFRLNGEIRTQEGIISFCKASGCKRDYILVNHVIQLNSPVKVGFDIKEGDVLTAACINIRASSRTLLLECINDRLKYKENGTEIAQSIENYCDVSNGQDNISNNQKDIANGQDNISNNQKDIANGQDNISNDQNSATSRVYPLNPLLALLVAFNAICVV